MTHAHRIDSGTPEGDALGFVESLLFRLAGGQANTGRSIFTSSSPGTKNQGNTQALLSQWVRKGYDVRVVMPRPIMQHILQKLQFVPAMEYIPEWYEGMVECWRRPVEWLSGTSFGREQEEECTGSDHLSRDGGTDPGKQPCQQVGTGEDCPVRKTKLLSKQGL